MVSKNFFACSYSNYLIWGSTNWLPKRSVPCLSNRKIQKSSCKPLPSFRSISPRQKRHNPRSRRQEKRVEKKGRKSILLAAPTKYKWQEDKSQLELAQMRCIAFGGLKSCVPAVAAPPSTFEKSSESARCSRVGECAASSSLACAPHVRQRERRGARGCCCWRCCWWWCAGAAAGGSLCCRRAKRGPPRAAQWARLLAGV